MIPVHNHVADHILNNRRLRAVPPAVIEEVLRIGLDWLANHVPAETPASDLTAIDFEACEACGHLIDPDKTEGAHVDSDGIWVCNACHVEAPPAVEP